MLKKIITIFLMVLCVASISVTANALSICDVQYAYNLTKTSESVATPFADVIVIKTRLYNGIPQYRRWNETKNCWVDPYWINF